MSKYNNGKIYKITSSQTDKVYIGSTIQTLQARLGKHLYDYTNYQNGIGHYVTSFEVCQYDDCEIKLVKKYVCDNKKELHQFEGKWIKIYQGRGICVNKVIAGRSYQEYKQDNRDEINRKNGIYMQSYMKNHKDDKRKYDQEYRVKNIEAIRLKDQQTYTCECGITLTKRKRGRHEKSKYHLEFEKLR